MTFISFRRELLDRILFSHQFLKGKNDGIILDVGGVKQRRGKFQIPPHLKNNWKTLNNNQETHPDILCELPEIKMPKECVDEIIMTEVLEYVPDYQKLLSECHRVLKKDGQMLITFPFLSPLHGDKQFDSIRLTPTHFEKVISEYFEIVEMRGMGGPLLVYLDAIRGEWITHGKNRWWQKLWWKKVSLFKGLVIFCDQFLFKNPLAATTGHYYLLKRRN